MRTIDMVGGWVVLSGNDTTSWLHLASWDLLDFQLKLKVQDGAELGGWVVLSGNNTTLWLHLASWNLPDSQLS